MLAIHKIFWHEFTTKVRPVRQNEPQATMEDFEQVKSYVKAYEWGGPTTTLMMHHLKELSKLIRPGDTVCDLACGPGSLLLELASIYPDTKFIGIDLSTVMLDYLKKEADRLQLKNVSVLCEDISVLPSLAGKQVDLVITTSALHHLPDETTLRNVFKRLKTLIKSDGGFYFFDFGLLKSQKSQDICVAEVAKLAPPITVQDYHVSLQAAFPIATVFQMAEEEIARPFAVSSSSLFDFFYFLQTPARTTPSEKAKAHIKACRKYMTLPMKIELVMLQFLRNSKKIMSKKNSQSKITTRNTIAVQSLDKI
jgi:arsenite methyltransferase